MGLPPSMEWCDAVVARLSPCASFSCAGTVYFGVDGGWCAADHAGFAQAAAHTGAHQAAAKCDCPGGGRFCGALWCVPYSAGFGPDSIGVDTDWWYRTDWFDRGCRLSRYHRELSGQYL